MRRRMVVASFLVAWFCAQGVLTEAMQVYAWSRMFVRYSASMTWRAALDETLDPDKACPLCCAVRKVRETETSQGATDISNDQPKLVLVLLAAANPEIAARRTVAPDLQAALHPTEWHAAVPTPPPRSAAALA